MIKNKTKKVGGFTKFEGASKETKQLNYVDEDIRKIRHIVSHLYRIKNINRKREYNEDVAKIVLASEIGQAVLVKLLEVKMTQSWLEIMEQDILLSIYKAYLPINNDGY